MAEALLKCPHTDVNKVAARTLVEGRALLDAADAGMMTALFGVELHTRAAQLAAVLVVADTHGHNTTHHYCRHDENSLFVFVSDSI